MLICDDELESRCPVTVTTYTTKDSTAASSTGLGDKRATDEVGEEQERKVMKEVPVGSSGHTVHLARVAPKG